MAELPLPEVHHETVLDTGAQQLAGVYAKAFLGATEKAGQTEQALAELDSLIEDVFNRLPKFETVLASALISEEEKIAMIDRGLGPQASPMLLNFLKVLARHGRLGQLRAIQRAAHAQLNVLRGRTEVHVATATALDQVLREQIKDRLRGMLRGEPVLKHTVDPNLIGGIVLRVGDTVYDGSVASRLAQVRTDMINRSVHEIQSRRDRFRIAAGN